MASLTEFTDTLGEKHAAHLLKRTTFGPTIQQIKDYAALTPATALTSLLIAEETPSPPIDLLTGSSWVNPPTQNKAVEDYNSDQDTLHEYFKAWHTDVMLKSGLSIQERMVWFYHSHLPVRWTEVLSSEAIYYQNCLYRQYSLGNFKELFKKICVDNAMLVYLDGSTNKKSDPNENFAREMFELYSIGKGAQIEEGNYTTFTETDVKAATRVLTGWGFDEDFVNIDADTDLPTGKMFSITASDGNTELAIQHLEGDKVFSDAFDATTISTSETLEGYPTVEAAYAEVDDLIELIFSKIETARFIARKIYRHFVYHFISDEVETDIIQPLAQTFYDNDYEVLPMLTQLFSSQHFYDADDSEESNNNIGAEIKSPVELGLGLLKFFEVEIPDRETQTESFYTDMLEGIVTHFYDQGINYYEPFEVAGYPAYHQMPAYARNWIMPTELAKRYQIGEIYMQRIENDSETISFKLDILDWIENSGYVSDPSDAEAVVTVLTTYLLAVEINEDRYDYFLNTIFLDTLDSMTWQSEWNSYTDSGDDTVVRERLEVLLAKLVQTPEFQLL